VEHFRQKQPLSNDRAGGFPVKDSPPILKRTKNSPPSPKKNEATVEKREAVQTS
jgi:hypothetical protein